jgi:hypothetical protein
LNILQDPIKTLFSFEQNIIQRSQVSGVVVVNDFCYMLMWFTSKGLQHLLKVAPEASISKDGACRHAILSESD